MPVLVPTPVFVPEVEEVPAPSVTERLVPMLADSVAPCATLVETPFVLLTP
jgi:hypothetical protein